jgi:uncharacterized protein (DUF2249 family)
MLLSILIPLIVFVISDFTQLSETQNQMVDKKHHHPVIPEYMGYLQMGKAFQPVFQCKPLEQELENNHAGKNVNSWSSKRTVEILWNLAKICALLDFT